jgi:hypothetical protein
MTKLKNISFDCLRDVDWEQSYKDKTVLLDVINFVSNNTDLVYEHLRELYDDGQEEVEVNIDAVLESLEGTVNLLDALQDAADEEGLWKHPLPYKEED